MGKRRMARTNPKMSFKAHLRLGPMPGWPDAGTHPCPTAHPHWSPVSICQVQGRVTLRLPRWLWASAKALPQPKGRGPQGTGMML